MKIKWVFFLFTFLLFSSCQKNDEKLIAERQKEAKKKEKIFNNINNGWNFSKPSLGYASQTIIGNWNELRLFMSELNEKPKSSIGAFQKKAKNLSKKAIELNKNIPPKFYKPEIKSRIAVLITKINMIDLFINLQDIPDQKVLTLVADVNIELNSLYRQMDEIVRKSEIPKEAGEIDMIQMLDTARAIPTIPKNKILVKN